MLLISAISVIVSSIIVTALMLTLRLFKRRRSIPTYIYDEDTTVLDDSKLPNISINSTSDQAVFHPTTSATFRLA